MASSFVRCESMCTDGPGRWCQTAHMAPASRPVLVLDSASLYYRSFFALPESMTAPDGRPHNAVRGFLSTVTRLVDAQPRAGSSPAGTTTGGRRWRVDLIPRYKAHRVAAEPTVASGGSAEAEPETLGRRRWRSPTFSRRSASARWGVDGYEADDVIGSLAAQLDRPTVVVSGDRDLVQIVDGRSSVLLTVNGGMDKWPLLDPAGARERFGVAPSRYVDLAVLRGDPSDGLPGVPGIGAKTAVALVAAFGAIDEILAAARAAAPARPMTARLAAALLAHEDSLARTTRVARVVRI